MNEEGIILRKDPVHAMKLYKLAADKGHALAKSYLYILKSETDELLICLYSSEDKQPCLEAIDSQK